MNLHRHWDMVFCIVFVFPKLKYFYTRFPYKSVVEEMKKKKVMDLLKRDHALMMCNKDRTIQSIWRSWSEI